MERKLALLEQVLGQAHLVLNRRRCQLVNLMTGLSQVIGQGCTRDP